MTGRIPRLQALVKRNERRNADVLYPYRPTWSDGSQPRMDVAEADPRGRSYVRAVALAPDLAQQDVRLVSYHPDDRPPGELASCPFDGGRLTLRHWGQVDEYEGTAVGVAVWDAP